MDRHFDVPADPAHSPDYVHIRSFDAEPYLGCRSLRYILEITDSNVYPDVEIGFEDHEVHAVSSSNIIGLANNTAMFTVNNREPTKVRSCSAKVSLTYPDKGWVD